MDATHLDDRDRPRSPPIPGATADHRRIGRKLRLIHEMHVAALDETMEMMTRVESGELEAHRLAAQVDTMELTGNIRKFGNLCGRECQFLDFHHTAEDNEIFPVLYRNGTEGLKRVIDRLSLEHQVVHQLLERLADDVNGIQLDPTPRTFAMARATFARLYDVVLSHFAYEETELEEALGYHGVVL